MRFIGITGGVGAGKSEILRYLAQRKDTRVMLADEIAHRLMEPGEEVYRRLCEAFAGIDIFCEEEQKQPRFDRDKLANAIFGDSKNRARMNQVVHPAVKAYVREEAARERKQGRLRLLVLEAALLIEEEYDAICDELWYIYTSEDVRRVRLVSSRGYSDAKIDRIFASQLKEEDYRAHCKVVIDNNGEWEETRGQIEKALRRGADE